MLLKVRKGVPQTMNDGDNPTFDQWLVRVNGFLDRVGLSTNDLPDQPYRDWYDDRLRPIRAANRALRAAGAEIF